MWRTPRASAVLLLGIAASLPGIARVLVFRAARLRGLATSAALGAASSTGAPARHFVPGISRFTFHAGALQRLPGTSRS